MMDKTKFYKKFREIAGNRIRKLNELFLDLEKDATDGERLKHISREMHSLKGEARMIGFEKTNLLLHRLEDLLGGVKEGRISFSDNVSDLFFGILDSVDMLVDMTIEGREDEFELEKIFSDIDILIQGDPPKKGVKETDHKEIMPVKEEIAPAPVAIMGDTIRIDLKKLDSLGNLAGQVIINKIGLEEILRSGRNLLGELRIQNKLWVKIREDLDEYKDELGGIMSNGFLEYLESYERGMERFKDKYIDLIKRQKVAFFEMETVSSMLKENIISLRLCPLTDMFSLFRRNVRDIARKQKKKVRLEIGGENTEIDQQIYEKLSEIILHLIRNAIDHGIEPVDERIKKGKPEQGCLIINAYHKGESVCIEVKDDGRGIDPENMKDLAIKKKTISKDEAEKLNDKDALYLIFRSGFSASPMITDVSGRGVGLDVVRRNVEELRGELLLMSETGRGTGFLMRFPLTLALMNLLILEVRGEKYAIPSLDIESCVEIGNEEIDLTGEMKTFVHDKKIIPIVSLGDLLGVNGQENRAEGRVSVIITRHIDEYLGLEIDNFIVEQEMVIKNLGRQLGKVMNISCLTTMGDGELVPVLHIPDIYDSVRKKIPESKTESVEDDEARETLKRILIVEDSLITREMEKNVLEAAGYDVEVAKDGVEGLSRVENEDYDLIITDIEMPGLDGLQLTKKIKQDEKRKEMPVIIMSTLASEEDKKNGLRVGADAYITKSSFDQGSLLEIIERLI